MPYISRISKSDDRISKNVLIAYKERMWEMLVVVNQKQKRSILSKLPTVWLIIVVKNSR